MRVIFISGLEDELTVAEELAQGIASANIKPWQRELKPGDCFVRFEDGIAIYSVVLPDEDYDDAPDGDYRFTKSYSLMCEDGELGSVHLSTAFKKISREAFEAFRKKGWPAHEGTVKDQLQSN